MNNMVLNIDYESQNTLEFEFLRKAMLERVSAEFATKNFNLQYNDFFSVRDDGHFDIIDKMQKIGAVYCTKPNSFIVTREDGYITINIISRQGKKLLNCMVYSDAITNIKKILKSIETSFVIVKDSECNINVRWYYMQSNNRLDYTTIPETINEVVTPLAYPYIENMDSFIESYIASVEPVMVLVGLAGSGKTRLLRHIVRCISKKIIKERTEKNLTAPSYDPYDLNDDFTPVFAYTNDSRAMRSDEIFVDFIGDSGIYGLIMEDMDDTLKPRQDGNSIMSKLLSSSDGFIANYNKKMILTSNIANINNIDEAFKRPGRCYGMVKTRKLTGGESIELLKVISPDKNYEQIINLGGDYSLAEIYKLVRESTLPTVKGNNVIGF